MVEVAAAVDGKVMLHKYCIDDRLCNCILLDVIIPCLQPHFH